MSAKHNPLRCFSAELRFERTPAGNGRRPTGVGFYPLNSRNNEQKVTVTGKATRNEQ